MLLTWKDLITTILLILTGILFNARYMGASWPLIHSTRWMIILLGVIGIFMCAFGAGDIISWNSEWIIIASGLGVISTLLIITGLITGAEIIVSLLIYLIVLLWLLSTLRHLIGG